MTLKSINICKYGIDYNDVPEMFIRPMLILLDDRDGYGEDRWIGIGIGIGIGILLELVGVVVYTKLEGDIIRIISARKATKREVKGYADNVKD